MADEFRRFTRLLRSFATDRSGATAIEYSLIASGVAGAVILAVVTLGETVQNNLYAKIAAAFQ